MTYYEILEVPESATYSEIKSSYRRLVKLYHPDLNPSEAAKEKIRLLTEAYETLSDPIKKQSYDWKSGSFATQSTYHYAPPQPTEEEIRKKEYLKWKREQEQKHWEQILHWKIKFYKMQRYFAFVFLFISLLYTYDYFITDVKGEFPITEIGLSRWGDCGASIGFMTFKTDRVLFDDVKHHKVGTLKLHYSMLMDVPVGVSIDQIGYYRFFGTLHSFNNFFSYLLLALAIILALNRNYSDWSLTLGLVPFFIATFLLLITYLTVSGISL